MEWSRDLLHQHKLKKGGTKQNCQSVIQRRGGGRTNQKLLRGGTWRKNQHAKGETSQHGSISPQRKRMEGGGKTIVSSEAGGKEKGGKCYKNLFHNNTKRERRLSSLRLAIGTILEAGKKKL